MLKSVVASEAKQSSSFAKYNSLCWIASSLRSSQRRAFVLSLRPTSATAGCAIDVCGFCIEVYAAKWYNQSKKLINKKVNTTYG